MELKILEILKQNPYLSNREIGKIVGLSRSGVLKYMNKLNIHRDRKTMLKLNNTSRQKELLITYNVEQIILGSILGDGYMSPNRHPENTKLTLNSELRINHGIKQELYIKYIKLLLENEGVTCSLYFYDGKSKKTHYIRGNKVKENGTWYLKTQRNVSFNKYRNLFYNDKKYINKYIEKLDVLGLAIWAMDDGTKAGNSLVLCTNGFTFNDVEFLRCVLKRNFNLDTTLRKSSLGHPMIYIKSQSMNHFRHLVEPYICESMYYKFGIVKSRESAKVLDDTCN